MKKTMGPQKKKKKKGSFPQRVFQKRGKVEKEEEGKGRKGLWRAYTDELRQ